MTQNNNSETNEQDSSPADCLRLKSGVRLLKISIDDSNYSKSSEKKELPKIACVGQNSAQPLVDDKELFEESREEEKNDGVRPYDESENFTPTHGTEMPRRLNSNQLTLVTSRSENSSEVPVSFGQNPSRPESPRE